MDGSRRHNIIEGGATKQVLMSGAWIKENVLEVRARYIETCRENVLTFTFEDDMLYIKENSNMAFGAPKDKITKARIL